MRYEDVILASRPRAYLPLAEPAGFPRDWTRNGNDATAEGGTMLKNFTTLLPSSQQPTVYFQSANPFFAIPGGVDTSAAFSVEIWARVFSTSAAPHSVVNRLNGSHPTGIPTMLWMNNASPNQWAHHFKADGGGQETDCGGPVVRTGAVYYLVACAAAGTGASAYKLYVNGQLTGTITPISRQNAGTWRIGYNALDSFWSYAEGQFGHLALYDRELGPAEINQHYLAGLGMIQPRLRRAL